MGMFDMTLGVLLVGVFFNTYLFGIVSYQFIVYYQRSYNDRWWIKQIVHFLVVLDTFHSASLIYMAWVYCVENFNNPVALLKAPWPFTFTPIGTAMAAIVTHMFMVFRIYHLGGKKKWILAVFIPPIITAFALGVACGTKAWMLVDYDKFAVLTPLVTCWLGMQTVVDLVIAVVMAFVLMRSKTGFKRTDGAIHRLVRGAIQIGVFSSIFAIGDLVGFAVAPQTNFYGMFAVPLGRIYTNTLMDTLNMRETLKDMLSSEWVSSPGTIINASNSAIPFSRGIRVTEQIELGDTESQHGGATMVKETSSQSESKYSSSRF